MKTSLVILIGVILAVSSLAATRYVDVKSTTPIPPYTSWATAANVIQDAVDAAVAGDEIVVTNGIYATGGRAVQGTMTNRVSVEKPITLRSVNGPLRTVVQGYQVPGPTNADGAIRGVYLTNGASLIGFTLTNGATRWVDESWPYRQSSGGGVWCEPGGVIISNCVVIGNAAHGPGGGVFQGTMNNCWLQGNVANGLSADGIGGGGGGAYQSTLNNCTIAGNLAFLGGAMYYGVANNCIVTNNVASNHGGGGFASGFRNCTVTGNSAVTGGGGASESWLFNSIVYYNNSTGGDPDSVASMGTDSCTSGSLGPYSSARNITNAPLFVSGNLRLRSDSPCINSGRNDSAVGPKDFDGNPRIRGGTVDMGAYEFQTPASVISYAWLQRYGLPINGSADYADSDGEGMNNWQEWRSDTVPTNTLSALRMLSPTNTASGLTVRWESVNTRSYWLERANSLSPPVFSTIASNLPGQTGTTTFIDTNAIGSGPLFYRVGVQP